MVVKPRGKNRSFSESDSGRAKTKLNSITEGLDANFRALMELHEEVDRLNNSIEGNRAIYLC